MTNYSGVDWRMEPEQAACQCFGFLAMCRAISRYVTHFVVDPDQVRR
jgi:hypothetical protein